MVERQVAQAVVPPDQWRQRRSAKEISGASGFQSISAPSGPVVRHARTKVDGARRPPPFMLSRPASLLEAIARTTSCGTRRAARGHRAGRARPSRSVLPVEYANGPDPHSTAPVEIRPPCRRQCLTRLRRPVDSPARGDPQHAATRPSTPLLDCPYGSGLGGTPRGTIADPVARPYGPSCRASRSARRGHESPASRARPAFADCR